MSDQSERRATCPECGDYIRLTNDGCFYRHKIGKQECPWGGTPHRDAEPAEQEQTA